jgi:hypothetical protein
MTIRRAKTRRRRSHVSENTSLREQSGTVEQRGPLQDQQWKATEAYQENPHSVVNQGNTGSSEQAKRKAKTDARHRMRSAKRARMAMSKTDLNNTKCKGKWNCSYLLGASNQIVPWEHRGLLSQTRGAEIDI